MLATRYDGLLITGAPRGISRMPVRTEFEPALIRAALAVGRPVLAICKGRAGSGRSLRKSIADKMTGRLTTSRAAAD